MTERRHHRRSLALPRPHLLLARLADELDVLAGAALPMHTAAAS